MGYLMQFGVIIGLSLVGELLNSIIPLPVPHQSISLIVTIMQGVSSYVLYNVNE